MKRLSCFCGWGNFEPLCLPLDFIFLGTVCIFIKIKPFFILKRWWCEFVIANLRGWMTWSSRKWLPGAEVLRINQSFYSCFPRLFFWGGLKIKTKQHHLRNPKCALNSVGKNWWWLWARSVRVVHAQLQGSCSLWDTDAAFCSCAPGSDVPLWAEECGRVQRGVLWLKVRVLDSWFEGEFHQINLLSESCYATFVF